MQDKREQYKFHAQVVEWQTRSLASMFTVAARDTKQARAINKIVKDMKLPLADEESDIINSGRSIETVDGEAQATSNKVDENIENYIDLDDQPSFENLMSAFSDLDYEEIAE